MFKKTKLVGKSPVVLDTRRGNMPPKNSFFHELFEYSERSDLSKFQGLISPKLNEGRSRGFSTFALWVVNNQGLERLHFDASEESNIQKKRNEIERQGLNDSNTWTQKKVHCLEGSEAKAKPSSGKKKFLKGQKAHSSALGMVEMKVFNENKRIKSVTADEIDEISTTSIRGFSSAPQTEYSWVKYHAPPTSCEEDVEGWTKIAPSILTKEYDGYILLDINIG